MNKKRGAAIVSLIALCMTLPLWGQPEVITFRARFLHNTRLITNTPISGRVGSSSFISDSNGEIRVNITVTPGQETVRMLLQEAEWKLLYPANGSILLPRNPETVVDIHLGKESEYERQLELINELQRIRDRLDDQAPIEAALASFGARQLSALDEQFLKAIDQQMQLRDQIRAENDRRADLLAAERAATLQRGRLETRNLLNSVVDHYISRSLDLKDILQFRGKQVFNRDWVVAEIKEKIDAYSEAYEALNRNREKILNMVASYWPDDYPKVNQTQQLLQYALDDLHKTTALTANPLLNSINEFNQGKGNKKRRKTELAAQVEALVYELSIKINTLTDRKSKIFQLLQQE